MVGSGVAGSATALIAAERFKIPVTMLFAGQTPEDCNSYWAQGGIIYRNYDITSGDSVESLEQDIHRAGAGLCDPKAVLKVAMEGPERVRQLLLSETFAQVPFDRTESGELSLCLGTFLWNLVAVFLHEMQRNTFLQVTFLVKYTLFSIQRHLILRHVFCIVLIIPE